MRKEDHRCGPLTLPIDANDELVDSMKKIQDKTRKIIQKTHMGTLAYPPRTGEIIIEGLQEPIDDVRQKLEDLGITPQKAVIGTLTLGGIGLFDYLVKTR